ncbi:MAG: hypothetical protein ABTR54_09245 [Candidatus Competibacter sp.]
MASNTLSVDPRIVTNLVCDASGGLSRFPKDTLHRVSITLEFLSELLGNYNGEGDLLESENNRFALSLQLSGMAGVLDAVGDALQIRTPKAGEDEIVLRFSQEELGQLTVLACRQEESIEGVILSIVSDALQVFDPSKRHGSSRRGMR